MRSNPRRIERLGVLALGTLVFEVVPESAGEDEQHEENRPATAVAADEGHAKSAPLNSRNGLPCGRFVHAGYRPRPVLVRGGERCWPLGDRARNVTTGIRVSRMADDRCDLLCLDLEKAERLRRDRLNGERAVVLAGHAKALSDPTRLIIAVALGATDELCVCDLAWVTERAENLVSHHARTLRSLGLAHSRRDGKMVLYSLTDSGRRLLAGLLDSAEMPA